MTKKELIDRLNSDIRREYSHWHFYMQAAAMVEGLHHEEYKEFFNKEAAGEMLHIRQFSDMIVGLGAVPATIPANFKSDLTNPRDLLTEAMKIEMEVVEHYVQRQDDADELGRNGGMDKVDGRRVDVFLDDQILDSRAAVDTIRKMLAGFDK